MFLPMTLVYPLLIAIHFVQLRDGNRVETCWVARPGGCACCTTAVTSASRGPPTWRVPGIGFVAVICLCAMLLVTVDSGLASVGLGGRAAGVSRQAPTDAALRPPDRLGVCLARVLVLLFFRALCAW